MLYNAKASVQILENKAITNAGGGTSLGQFSAVHLHLKEKEHYLQACTFWTGGLRRE